MLVELLFVTLLVVELPLEPLEPVEPPFGPPRGAPMTAGSSGTSNPRSDALTLPGTAASCVAGTSGTCPAGGMGGSLCPSPPGTVWIAWIVWIV
jgi:hypothetical protein